MARDVLAERREIDQAVEGRTLLDLYERNASRFGELPALASKRDDEWRSISWREYRDRAREIAAGLLDLGIGHGDFVAIMAGNVLEHVIADAAAMYAGATPVSIYNTLAPEQIAYVAKDCRAKVAILQDRGYAKRWEEIRSTLPDLRHVVLVSDADDFRFLEGALSWDELAERGRQALRRDSDLVTRAAAALRPEDPATLVYTSGTTGPPKGTIITHRNVLWILESVLRMLEVPMHPRMLSYLPLAHVAERFTTHWAALDRAAHVSYVPEIAKAMDAAREIRPQIFLAVPRVWEKVRDGVLASLRAEANTVRRELAQRAIQVGLTAARLERTRNPLALAMRPARMLFDRLVYAKIRARLGLDRARIVATGSAPLSVDVHEFFAGIGLPILDTWGMTELSALGTFVVPGRQKIGTVGPALPGVELRIAGDGEILVRGGNVTAGYLNRPKETAETFDADGWVHSGDLGALDPDGSLRIVGRKKEIIITAGGKNIAPNNIEALLKEHPLVGQACVVGDAKPYLSALVALDAETVRPWAEANGIATTDVAALSTDERLLTEIERAVESANARLSRVESIKRFRVLPVEWTTESGELTPDAEAEAQRGAGALPGRDRTVVSDNVMTR